MSLSAEQRQAYDALREAIEQARRADSDAEGDETARQYLMTDCIVLYAASRIDDEGETWTQVGHFLSDGGEVPTYRALGLVEYARVRLRTGIAKEID